MRQASFYIGADNETGEVNTEKIIEMVSQRFDGATIIPATGSWRGKTEASVVIIIGHEQSGDYLKRFAQALCTDLKQDAIGLSNGIDFELVTLDS